MAPRAAVLWVGFNWVRLILPTGHYRHGQCSPFHHFTNDKNIQRNHFFPGPTYEPQPVQHSSNSNSDYPTIKYDILIWWSSYITSSWSRKDPTYFWSPGTISTMIISCPVDGGHKDITRSLDQALCSEEYDARYTSLESAPNESHFYI